MLYLFRLRRLPFLVLPFITSVHSFQVIAPAQVTVGQVATVQWIRHNGDPSSFSVLLKRNDQDRGGTIVLTVRGTNDDKGSAQFTAVQDTRYLVTIIKELEISSNQLPSTLASSSTIVAVKGSASTVQNDPPANTDSNTNTNQSNTATPTSNNPPQDTNNPTNGSNSNNGDNSGGQGQNQGQQSSVTPTSTGAQNTQTGSGGKGDPSSLGPGDPQDKGDTSSPSTNRSATTNPPSATGTSQPSPAPTSPPSTPPAPSPKPNHTAAIVGGILGALVFLLLLLILYLWYRRRQRKRETQNFAFRRDLMVRPDQTQTTQTGTGVSFWPVSIASSGGPDTDTESSFQYGAGFTSNAPRVVSWTPSGSTNLSSSPSVFYTAAPAGSTTLAPGFVFPAREVTPAPVLSSSSGSASGSGSTAGQTARQTAIKNKMSQLRTQLLLLQSRSARESGGSESVSSMFEKQQQDRGEVQRIREELERLGGILNSGWALKRLESGGDVPAGLRT